MVGGRAAIAANQALAWCIGVLIAAGWRKDELEFGISPDKGRLWSGTHHLTLLLIMFNHLNIL